MVGCSNEHGMKLSTNQAISICPSHNHSKMPTILTTILQVNSDSPILAPSASENKKHLKNVGPIRHCKPPHAHSPDVASGTVARRLRIDVHDNADNDNAWQRGPLWPHGMGPKICQDFYKPNDFVLPK